MTKNRRTRGLYGKGPGDTIASGAYRSILVGKSAHTVTREGH